ncbi:MAG: glycosyltransferase [Planctomycetota bacterium]
MKLLVVSNGFPPRGSFGTEFYTDQMVRGLIARGHEVRVLHPVRDGSRPRYTLESVDVAGVPVRLLHNAGDPQKRFTPSFHDPEVERAFRAALDDWRPDCVHFTYLLWGLSIGLPGVARERGIPSVLTVTDHGLACHRGQFFDADLVHCHGPQPPAVCARCVRRPARFDHSAGEVALRRAAAELLAAFGGFGRVVVEADLARREAAVRAALECLTLIVAPTEVIAEPLLTLGLPRERVRVLPYAFDEAPYAAVRGSAPPKLPRFTFLGQFAPHKGLDVLVGAARELARVRPEPWEVVLHGAPSVGRHARYAPRVLAGIDGARVRRGAAFAPGGAPEVLAASTALVVPSLWDENAPLAVLEARSAGVPVLASRVRGIAEVVAEGVTGFLFEPGDVAALAGLMGRALDGELTRLTAPGLKVSLAAHLEALESIHAAARTR